MRKKIIAGLVIAFILLIAVYSRPVTLLKLYPMLTLDKCVEISGYYIVGTQKDMTQFVIKRTDEAFEPLFAQFYWQTYYRSIRDILPRGTRYHTVAPDDFQWNVTFTYKGVEFPDGSIHNGDMLQIQNWYGDLDIHFGGETHSFYTGNQDVWLKDILNIIQKTP